MSAGTQNNAGAIKRPAAQPIAWLLFATAFALVVFKFLLPAELIRLPEWLLVPFADWINAGFTATRESIMLVTRFISSQFEWLTDVTGNLLYGKRRWPKLGPIPWTCIAITAFFIGYALRGWYLALLSGGTFVWIAAMGQWKWAMETMSVIVVAAPVAILIGLLFGIAAWRSRRFERMLLPVLILAQSFPHFAYMIPVVVLFGVGPKSGAIVTIIVCVAPMILMTILGLKKVSPEIVESGQMSGATRFQLLSWVRIPSARAEILVGVNQVIMNCLAMVVLAAFIGMPGLGNKLLQLLQALKIGRSFEIGISIVLLAVVLDRCSKAWAQRQPEHFERETAWLVRNKILVLWAIAVVAAYVAAQYFPILEVVKRKDAFSIHKPIDNFVDVFVTWAKPGTELIRWFLITQVLVPMKNAYLYLPFTAVMAFVAAIAWRVGGWRSALFVSILIGYIAVTGWWDRAMLTAYTVTAAVIIAGLFGFPLGIWGSRKEKRAQRVLLFCDTMQTFPSFIYLIPAMMLFGVSDVSVILAIVLFTAVPLIRYTIEGLRGVPHALVEASQMSGASEWQTLRVVRLPMALPTIMVGINQSVVFALFMAVIAAFIGTQDLGQELQRALSFSDMGKGTVLGLSVAFMGLIMDHIAMRWARDRKKALGLE